MQQLSTGCLCSSVHLLQPCAVVRMATFATSQWTQDDRKQCRVQGKPGSLSLPLTAHLTKPEMSATPYAIALIVCVQQAMLKFRLVRVTHTDWAGTDLRGGGWMLVFEGCRQRSRSGGLGLTPGGGGSCHGQSRRGHAARRPCIQTTCSWCRDTMKAIWLAITSAEAAHRSPNHPQCSQSCHERSTTACAQTETHCNIATTGYLHRRMH